MKYRYSGLDTAHSCLRKFKEIYIDGAPSEESIDMLFGTSLHAGLQAMLEGDNAGATFKAVFDTSLGSGMKEGRKSTEELYGLGGVFLGRFERLHRKKFGEGKCEAALSGKIGGFDVEGTADFVGLYEGVPSILDFKTSAYAYPKEKILTSEQMPIYAELAKQCLGFEAKQIVYYVFCKGEGRIQTLTRTLTQEFLDMHLANVLTYIQDLDKRTTWPKNSNSCMYGRDSKCSFFDKCWGGHDAA